MRTRAIENSWSCLRASAAMAVVLLIVPARIALAECTVPRDKIPANLQPQVRRAIDDLYSENQIVRATAAWNLGELRSKESVPFLIGLLQDHNGEFAQERKLILWQPPDLNYGKIVTSPGREAAKALVKIGPPAVDSLLAVLKENTPMPARSNAVWALGEMRERRAADALLEVWTEESAVALGRLGDVRAIPKLIAKLGENEVEEPIAAGALVEMGEPTIEPLIAAMSNKESKPEIRAAAASVLRQLKAPRAVDALIAAVRDPNAAVLRIRSVEALDVFADPKSAAVLLELLKDDDWQIRKLAAHALGAMKAASAVDPLRVLLKDPDLTVRGHAARALGEIGAKNAADELLPLMDDKEVFVRSCAMEALARLKEPRALDKLYALLTVRDTQLRRRAAAALGKIGDARACDHLIELLRDRDEPLRTIAEDALKAIGQPAIGRICSSLTGISDKDHSDSENWNFATELARSLGKIGGEDAVAAAAPLLTSGNWRTEASAERALVDMGEPGVARLIDAATHGGARAAQALHAVHDPRLHDALVSCLKTGDDFARMQAAYSLNEQKDVQAVEALIGALETKNGETKKAVVEALENITGQYNDADSSKWTAWWNANKDHLLKSK